LPFIKPAARAMSASLRLRPSSCVGATCRNRPEADQPSRLFSSSRSTHASVALSKRRGYGEGGDLCAKGESYAGDRILAPAAIVAIMSAQDPAMAFQSTFRGSYICEQWPRPAISCVCRSASPSMAIRCSSPDRCSISTDRPRALAARGRPPTFSDYLLPYRDRRRDGHHDLV
jgi:hypothetical protein